MECGYGRLILTGGFAVEVYTGSAYRTGDVDIIAQGDASRILSEFMKSGELGLRVYLLRRLSKALEIVSNTYTKPLKPILLRIGDYKIYIEPPEELIITYLNGWKYWGSSEDKNKGLHAARIMVG